MSKFSEWWERTNEKIARMMYPDIWVSSDTLREINAMLRENLEASGVDVDVELARLDDE